MKKVLKRAVRMKQGTRRAADKKLVPGSNTLVHKLGIPVRISSDTGTVARNQKITIAGSLSISVSKNKDTMSLTFKSAQGVAALTIVDVAADKLLKPGKLYING